MDDTLTKLALTALLLRLGGNTTLTRQELEEIKLDTIGGVSVTWHDDDTSDDVVTFNIVTHEQVSALNEANGATKQ